MAKSDNSSFIVVDGIAIDHDMVQLMKRLIDHHKKTEDITDLKRSLFMIQNAVLGLHENDVCLGADKFKELSGSFYFIYSFYDELHELLKAGGTDKQN